MLSQIHLQIGNFIQNNYLIALFCYFLIYLLLMACALPFAGLMDLLGGFYFGWVSFPIALVSVTIGSIIPFSIAKYYGGQSLERYEINILKNIENHCNNNEIKYVVIMRIIPWAPFSVATMLAGALKIKSSNFMTGTALGFLPWGFGLNELGQGFASILQMEQITILEVIKTPTFFLGLIITIGAIAGGKFIKTYYQKILK